ncbi:MAG: hypothetical protein ACI9DJ_002492, partial [Algoriphagus sp.]
RAELWPVLLALKPNLSLKSFNFGRESIVISKRSDELLGLE